MFYNYYDRCSNCEGGDRVISSDAIRGYNDAIILSILSKKIPTGTKSLNRFARELIQCISSGNNLILRVYTPRKQRADPFLSWRSHPWQRNERITESVVLGRNY